LPLLGINRFVIVADSDREAMALGRRAWPSFHQSFMKLWKLHGTQPRFARMPEDFDTLVEHGGGIAGSPATVRDRVRAMMREAGANYFIGQFSFGDLAHEEVMHSAGLFAREVLPMGREIAAQAAG
jgi:alkanesulfonate monooxygenase SsuD/methylene tetrahydromethanopterin reductase-like flavin-dependent oxidoreductase (luciferase family)